jgi:hypothetical protein
MAEVRGSPSVPALSANGVMTLSGRTAAIRTSDDPILCHSFPPYEKSCALVIFDHKKYARIIFGLWGLRDSGQEYIVTISASCASVRLWILGMHKG